MTHTSVYLIHRFIHHADVVVGIITIFTDILFCLTVSPTSIHLSVLTKYFLQPGLNRQSLLPPHPNLKAQISNRQFLNILTANPLLINLKLHLINFFHMVNRHKTLLLRTRMNMLNFGFTVIVKYIVIDATLILAKFLFESK